MCPVAATASGLAVEADGSTSTSSNGGTRWACPLPTPQADAAHKIGWGICFPLYLLLTGMQGDEMLLDEG